MPYLVFDLEMSGPDPGVHEIIQIGAVLLSDNWVELGVFISNVCPEDKESFTESAAKIHGLTWDELQEAPLIYEVIESFESWIRKLLKRNNGDLRDIITCGQSVIYDINFLKFAYRYENMLWPFSNTLIDLHTLAYFGFRIMEANGKSTPRSHSLKSLAEWFGFTRDSGTHNALEDAELTTLCFKEFFNLASRLKIEQH